MVDVQYAPGTTLSNLTPQTRAVWNSIVAAADGVGITNLQFNAGRATDGHVSHMHGTEIDFIGYNADGTPWTVRQRLALAEAAGQVGANRFGFYTRGDRPVSILHVGVGYEGSVHNAAWGPNGQTNGVGVDQFYPEEQAFVASLRNGELSSYQPLAYAEAQRAQPDAFNHIFSTAPTLNSLIQRGGILGRGDNGDAVRELQRFLNTEGYKDASGNSLAEDGDFGQRTRQALESYQRAHDLTADGRVGPQTFAQMFQRITDSEMPAVPQRVAAPAVEGLGAFVDGGGFLRPGDTGDNVSELQRALNAMGYTDRSGNALVVDGEFGPATREAVRQYQSVNGLSQDAVIGPQTMELLRYDYLRSTPAQPAPEIPDYAGMTREQLRAVDVSTLAPGADTEAYNAATESLQIGDAATRNEAQRAAAAENEANRERGISAPIGPNGVPTDWRPVPPAGPVPTTQDWTTKGPLRNGAPIVPGPAGETPYDAPVESGPSPQPPLNRQTVAPGIAPPNFGTMSLQELQTWWTGQLSAWRPGQPRPVQPPAYTVAYNFRREEAQRQATGAQQDLTRDAAMFRYNFGTNPRVAPPAPVVERSIGEGEYLPHEQILLKQVNSNMVNAPISVIPAPVVGGFRTTPTSAAASGRGGQPASVVRRSAGVGTIANPPHMVPKVAPLPKPSGSKLITEGRRRSDNVIDQRNAEPPTFRSGGGMYDYIAEQNAQEVALANIMRSNARVVGQMARRPETPPEQAKAMRQASREYSKKPGRRY